MEATFFIAPSLVALAFFAVRRGFLTPRGAVVAVVVGTLTALAGIPLFILLVSFFISSSLLTRARSEYKKALGLKDISGRSLRQVVGVGTPIAIFAALYIALGRPEFLGAAVVSIAVATADTWASEIGVAYGGKPRHILTPWRRLEPGTSGGVTPVGTAASIGGALFISLLAQGLGLFRPFWLVALFGWLGELLDSLLGATAQIRYICNGEITENYAPGCVKRGYLTNESVNMISGLLIGVLFIATNLLFS